MPVNQGRLFLESERGTRINEIRCCAECGLRGSPFWRYRESSRGVVFLCDYCKPLVYERSHGRVDALSMSFQGGKFEGNRRRH
jgi:hypothetical protein